MGSRDRRICQTGSADARGHRRYQAALQLGYTELPIEIETFVSEEAELERLLRENENRGKTPEQQIREGMTWEPIETYKASERMRLSQGQGIKGVKNFTDVKGDVRDIIAHRVGLGSGVTYEKGKMVVEAIDKELTTGDTKERGKLLRMKLNEESINAASKLLQKLHFESFKHVLLLWPVTQQIRAVQADEHKKCQANQEIPFMHDRGTPDPRTF